MLEGRDSDAADRQRASAVVLRNPSGHVLMIKENYGLRRFGFPGGRVEAGESFEQAAVREAWEETGLRVALAGLAGSLHWIDEGERWEARLFFASLPDHAVPSVQDPAEIAEVRWVNAQALPSPLTRTASAYFEGELES